MKTVRNWADLKEFGINCLTGEACALSIRALCDLTEQGQANICEFFGIQPAKGVFADSWNGGTGRFFLFPALRDLARACGIPHDQIGVPGSSPHCPGWPLRG